MKLKYMIATSVVALFAATAAQAADVAPKKAPELTVAKAADFSGAYAGVVAGVSRVSHKVNKAGAVAADLPVAYAPLTLFSGSALVGYNFDVQKNVVAGVEFEATYVHTSKEGTDALPAEDKKTATASGDYANPTKVGLEVDTALRGRVGYVVGDFMPFASLGLTTSFVSREVKEDKTNATAEKKTAGVKESRLELGYTVGAGVDYALNKNLVLRAEYRLGQNVKAFSLAKEGADSKSLATATKFAQGLNVGLAYKF